MADTLPGDVIRIVDPTELPSTVRVIPESFDPLAEGILMDHQKDWIEDKADLKLAEKGRRTGITFAEALDDTITAATRRSEGGDNVFYVGDTKEKGLEFIGYCAHFSKVLATILRTQVSSIEEILFADIQPDGSSKDITAYRIRFSSGLRIMALSSRPAGIRGLQGIVVIDEAGFHQDVQGVIDACLALLIWGGKIRIISTHNGARNAFNQLVLDSLAGRQPFKVHHITFDDAVKNGLYERVCLMRGWPPSPEGKEAWYQKIRKSYGANLGAMREELDAVPREGSGVAIPTILIESCMKEVRPILRLKLEPEFSQKGERYRTSWTEDWIRQNLNPALDLLDRKRQHVFGSDFGRYADLSVNAPLSIEPDLVRKASFLIELHNVPTREQEQILWHMIDHLPNFAKGAMDASGSGSTLAEYTADRYGHDAIVMVMLNDPWYRVNMVPFQSAFHDQMLDLPRDEDVRNDLRMLANIDGIIKLPKAHQKDVKDGKIKRHGDAAIALALGYFASLQPVGGKFEVVCGRPLQTTGMLRGYA